MNVLDYVILVSALLGITIYGMWKTMGSRRLGTYLRGAPNTSAMNIGLSVLATQASAITFLSMPGQGYQNGLGFVQNYFGLPLALIIVAVVFLPIYRRFNVYTAYEYLGSRFDAKTRLLGAILFLIQRGLAAGITIYAPAIIISSVLGWRLDVTIVLSGILAIVYTVSGGSAAVNLTQKHQFTLITIGMFAALFILIEKLSAHLGLMDALTVAGGFQKMKAVDFSFDPNRRYTLWSGLFGGLFLSLSYFGADQSQVQRYISGSSLRESRLGLMFNAICKIPMQFLILILGVLLFVFYQFERPPIFFNEVSWNSASHGTASAKLQKLDQDFDRIYRQKQEYIKTWIEAKKTGNFTGEASAQKAAQQAQSESEALRDQAKLILHETDPLTKENDSDYIFITFILKYLPHGLIGLLVAAIFSAALGSKAAELNALATTSTIDIYRHFVPVKSHEGMNEITREAKEVWVTKSFTVFWGLLAISFALFANLISDMIEAVNILGSLFYGVTLCLFLVAFFLKWVGGNAVFCAAIVAQGLIFILFFNLKISYLWYNLIGCFACALFSVVFQSFFDWRSATHE